jgi:hypothetical protein
MELLESIRQLARTKADQTLRQDTEIQMVVVFVQDYRGQNDIEPKRLVSLVGAGAAAALSAEPVIAAVDQRPAAALAERVFPGHGEDMSSMADAAV